MLLSIPRSDCDGQEVWARPASTEGVTEVEVRGGRGDASRVKRPELIFRTLLWRRTAQDVSASCYSVMVASGSAVKSTVNLVLIVGDHSGFGGLEFFQVHGGKRLAGPVQLRPAGRQVEKRPLRMWPVAVALLARRVSKSARSASDLNLWSWSVVLVQGFFLFLWLYNLNIKPNAQHNLYPKNLNISSDLN